VRDLEVGRLLRMLRIRRGWRLRDVADRCGLSTATIGRTELGIITSAHVLRQHAASLDLRVEWRVVGRGADVARVLDDEHAAIVNALAATLRRAGLPLEAEASFSEYGERGRIDLVAFDPASETILVVEVKTELADLQDLFGGLNVKTRLAPTIAKRLSWPVSRTVTILAVAATARNRATVRSHAALFEPFARQSLRGGRISVAGGGRRLLWVAASAVGRRHWLAGRRRVRTRPAAMPAPGGTDAPSR